MDRLGVALLRVDKDLRSLRCRWALIGGLAVSVRGTPRTTEDIDLTVAVATDREAEHLVGELRARGYRYLPEQFHFHQRNQDRIATIRLLSPGGTGAQAVVDLLFASSGIEAEVVAASEVLEIFGGLRLPVATTGHLLALKALAAGPKRPQDYADLQSLASRASAAEVMRARQAVELIVGRGFGGDKDVAAELEKALRSAFDLG